MTFDIEVGRLVRAKRVGLNLTQKACGEAIGMTRSNFALLESGGIRWRVEDLVKLAHLFRCPLGALTPSNNDFEMDDAQRVRYLEDLHRVGGHLHADQIGFLIERAKVSAPIFLGEADVAEGRIWLQPDIESETPKDGKYNVFISEATP